MVEGACFPFCLSASKLERTWTLSRKCHYAKLVTFIKKSRHRSWLPRVVKMTSSRLLLCCASTKVFIALRFWLWLPRKSEVCWEGIKLSLGVNTVSQCPTSYTMSGTDGDRHIGAKPSAITFVWESSQSQSLEPWSLLGRTSFNNPKFSRTKLSLLLLLPGSHWQHPIGL